MNLEELLKDTEALTYINALKITLVELKAEFSSIEEMQSYMAQSCERAKKLIRRADNQYRLIAKLVNKDSTSLEGEINIEQALEELEAQGLIEEVMENNGPV